MVNKYIPLAILIALLSLSDYISLITAQVEIPDLLVFNIFFILSMFSFFYYNLGKVYKYQIIYIIFISLYLIMISLYNLEHLNFEGVNVAFSFFTAVFVYLVIQERSLSELYNLLSMSLLFYLLGALFLELVNKILGGNNLIIVFQNNIPYLSVFIFSLYSLRRLIGFNESERVLKFCTILIFSYILFVISEFGNYRIQFKIVFLMSFLMIFIFCEKLITKQFKLFKFFLLFFIFMSIPFFWLIQEQLELFVNVSGRLGSGMMRVEIFNAIISNFTTFEHMLIGSGLGASSTEYQVVHNNIMYEFRSHSGFLSLVLDYGLVGLIIFFWLPCFALLFKLRSYPQSFLYSFLVLFCWFFLNIVYLSAIPVSNLYNFSMLPLVLVSINLFKKYKTVE